MIPENVSLFQKDLKAGMTLEEALIKHNLTLNKALKELRGANYKRKPKRRKRYTFTGQKYITKQHDKYLIRKSIRKKMRYYGGYDSLEDAMTVRDYLDTHGWTRANVNRIRKELNYDRL